MFETLEVGKKLKKRDFSEMQLPLRQQLLKAQFDLAGRDYPVIIVVAGLDGAGKGSLVHRLNEWMDPRGIRTNTYWEHSDEEEERPFFYRFWRRLPARGTIGIFLGSWYTKPAQDAVTGVIDGEAFALACQQIVGFERMLTDDGALIIKLWLHVSEEVQRMQLEGKAPDSQQNPRVTDRPYELQGKYRETVDVCERLILATDSSHSPWHLIEAADRYYRDVSAGEIILQAMQSHSSRTADKADTSQIEMEIESEPAGYQPTVLDNVDLDLLLDKDDYKRQLSRYQNRLQDLMWQAYRQRRSVVAVFEGWDAAGKGSAIRRVTQAMDPRLYRLVQVGAPTDEERAQHYLWRFWRQLRRDGRATIFDRSWYGRVLVERVEQFARREEWHRAYSEINQFEKQLVDHGCILLKFWIHISADEQIRRFKAREEEPHKRHKITEEDWRNREKWHGYELAVDQMVSRTSTHHAPWTLVSGNDKRYARVQILKTFCKSMKTALDAS
jgi:polyphosphate:AMP phosphotransferase